MRTLQGRKSLFWRHTRPEKLPDCRLTESRTYRMETLKEKTAKGLIWGLMNNGSTQILNLIFGIFLGRLLTPSDYGMVGVLTIFTAIAGNLQSSGFTQALTNMKHPESRDYNAVFWFNVIVSISIYTILFFCAPLISLFFHQPALTELSRFVFLSFVISSFGIAHGAYMFKNLMVKENTVTGFAALVTSGIVGVVLAINGQSYWSLAWQQIIYITIINIGRYFYTPWHPTLHIDLRPIKKMLNFSMKILLTSIINTLNSNILVFIFGRLYPIKAVGSFTQANKWNTMAYSFLSGTMAQVAQPVMAQVTGDNERERRVFRKMMRLTAMLSFPAMFGLAMVAEEFILLTIHEQWLSSVPLLRILWRSIHAALHSVSEPYDKPRTQRHIPVVHRGADCHTDSHRRGIRQIRHAGNGMGIYSRKHCVYRHMAVFLKQAYRHTDYRDNARYMPVHDFSGCGHGCGMATYSSNIQPMAAANLPLYPCRRSLSCDNATGACRDSE